MAEKNDTDKQFDTCFANSPFAELMQKMASRQGVGSLCEEMMKKILEKKADCCRFYWAEIMGMTSLSSIGQEEPEETKEEESHVKGKH